MSRPLRSSLAGRCITLTLVARQKGADLFSSLFPNAVPKSYGSTASVVVVQGAGASPKLYYVWADHLNTPRQLTDPTANNKLVWEWTFGEAFGNWNVNEDPDVRRPPKFE